MTIVSQIISNFSFSKARQAQLQLAKRVIHDDVLPKKIRHIAGVDVAYSKDLSVGAVAVLDYTTLKAVESQIAFCKTRFPYVPTFLSFRETPPIVLAIKNLCLEPDVFLVDGHGRAHPRRCGLASYLGIVVGKPTIGVAKRGLIGRIEDTRKQAVKLLKDKDEIIGAVITTDRGSRPVYVSTGHMVSLETAIKIIKHCSVDDRIPKPILAAHRIATAARRKINVDYVGSR
ncbi:endonuclease V [Candidatus Bathyarchaeota archaeon]|nr:endonuclease V [Candidatus Bathyarchaeota archaeon]